MQSLLPCCVSLASLSARRTTAATLARLVAIMLLAPTIVSAQATASYDFCITRVMQVGSDVLRARLLFDDADPGVELAGHLLVRHYRQAQVTSVRIEDYRTEVCGNAETQFLALKAGAGPIRQAEPSKRLPELGKAVGQSAKLVSETYMSVARQASGALGLVLEATNEALCSMIRC